MFKILLLISSFAISASAQMTDDGVFSLVKSRNVSSVEQLIPLLPPAYHSNFTLVHASKSIQQASPLYPRAVLFGDDGRLLMSFNGHQSQFGANTLELLVFKEN